MALAIILTFCLLAPIPLLAGTSGVQAWEAATIAGQHEGRAILARSAASRGVILFAQVDETLQSFEDRGTERSDKSAPPPKKEKPTPGPSSISSVSDLKGCWTSAKGGTKLWDGVPYYFRYCFDKSGRAKGLSVHYDRNGKKQDQCVAGANAKMDGKGFVLTDDANYCPGWIPLVYDCKLRSTGTVSCTVKGEGRQTPMVMYYNADLKP
jgi:hypothetical protein